MKHIDKKIWRFVVVGVFNTLIDVMLYLALHNKFGLPIVLANIISTSIGLLVSYRLNSSFTFGASKVGWRKFAGYISTTLFGLWVLQPIIIELAIYANGRIDYISPFVGLIGHRQLLASLVPKLAATAVTTVWNFVWYSRVIFRAPKRRQTASRHLRPEIIRPGSLINSFNQISLS